MDIRTGKPHFRFLLAIETDATRYHGADAARPALLDDTQSGQLLAHLAADLRALLPDISNCSLIAPGALYDQTQILRPHYPVFNALESVAASDPDDRFSPGLVSVGARGKMMPVAELQPDQALPLGLLQLLPVVVHGPPVTVTELGQSMEYRFMEEGQISAHSANWLESAFGIAINHARMMTLTDLNAMLRMQLEHFGFLPLWELLDAALTGRREPLQVVTDSGKVLEWHNGRVRTAFETFDYWASHSGAGQPADRDILAGGYAEWTRENRQYLTTLSAHGVTMEFSHPEAGTEVHGNSFLVETVAFAPRDDHAAVTEHSFGELGTIAISVPHENRLLNYYPLTPQGLNDMHRSISTPGDAGNTMAFPGTILYDTTLRRLVPDCGPSEVRDG